MNNNTQIFKLLILSIIVLILSSSILAAGFKSTVEIVDKEIYPDEYAKYNLTITNLENYKNSYNVHVSRNWILTLDDQFSNLEKNETRSTILNIKPRTLVNPGKSYTVQVDIESTFDHLKKSYNIPLYLKSYNTNYGVYIPSLNLYAEYDSNVDPREQLKLNLRLRNRNALNISELAINIDGELFSKKLTESLLPQQEKIIQVPFDIDTAQIPGTYELNVDVLIEDTIYATLTEEYTLISYADVIITKDKSREFLKSLQTIKLENKGNIDTLKVVELEKNWIERIFISTNIDYDISTNDKNKKVMVWGFDLAPGEMVEIELTSNYRLLLVISIVIVLSLYLYYSLRSKIIVKKKASLIRVKGNDNISRLKLRLFVKNRSSKKLHDVEVIERISKLTELIENKHELGSAQPSKVIKGKRATIIKWNMDHFEPHEERIITYRLESKLKLVGSVQFPKSIVKFKDIEGRLLRTRSNKPTLELGGKI